MSAVDIALETYSATSSEAISAGMGCEILADGAVKKLTDSKAYAGVSKFDAASGEVVTVQTGIVHVLVSAAVTALDKLTCSATAGKFRTAVNAETVNGIALETSSGAGTIQAMMLPPGVFAPLADITWADESFGGAVATIADDGVAYVYGPAFKVTGTITGVTAIADATCTDAEDHITLELYKNHAGTQTLIWAKTTAADWTDAGVALVAEVGGTAAVAGDTLKLKITNATGASISPLGATVVVEVTP
jgi:hypothetical protein